MATNSGNATWQGGLKDGKGSLSTESGTLDAKFSFGSRFEDGATGTNPEELIGAAHAGCYSMFLSALLEGDGKTATEVKTEAKVHLGKDDTGPFIKKIDLTTTATVPGISDEEFQKVAQKAKDGCPISRALASVPEINLTATLKQG